MTRAGAICGAASPSPALRPRLMLASDEMARGACAAGARLRIPLPCAHALPSHMLLPAARRGGDTRRAA